MKVRVFSKQFKNKTGYDIRIEDESATVQDYLDAINAYIDDEKLVRGENLTACKGCDGCCWERLPLTYIDILNIQQAPGVRAAMTRGRPPLLEFLAKFTYVYVEGPAVDITFGRKLHGACTWLEEEAGCCRNYAWRPLVCQSFICSPSTKKAKELRSAIINQGMDELVRQAIQATGRAGVIMVMHEAYDPVIDPADWPENPFSGKTRYDEVLLWDLCSGQLWGELRGNA
ncbi:MAG: YkgJ family cysteine cluster protein [Bacillota bacterium]